MRRLIRFCALIAPLLSLTIATGPAAAMTTNDVRQPSPRLRMVSTVGVRRRLCASTAIRAPIRWLIASLKRPPPRLTE